MFGLEKKHINNLKNILSDFSQITKAVIYGSRAKGNFKNGSDIDITLFGDELNLKIVYKINEKIDKLNFPYKTDISIFNQIDNPDLIEHINRVGKVLYEKNNFPAGWEEKNLENVCEDIFAGGDVPKNNYSKTITEKHTIPIFTNGEKNNGLYGYSDIVRVTKPCITISARGTIGYSVIRKEKFYPAIRLIVVIPKSDILDLRFLKYAISDIDFKSSGTSIPQLTVPMIKKYKILFPPFIEQKRIVKILDKAFENIDKAKTNYEQNLKNAKELFESYLNNIFETNTKTCEEKKLGNVCYFTQGIQRDVKLQSEVKLKNQVRFLRIVDFTQGNELPRYIDNPGDKYILKTNDVSLVRYGASTGFVCRGLEGALANNLFRVIPKSYKELSNDFLYIFLKSPQFQNIIKENMNGAAMPAISFGMIKEIPIPIFSIKEQQTIVKNTDFLFSEIIKLETNYSKKIKDLLELKKSILQKAFNGEL